VQARVPQDFLTLTDELAAARDVRVGEIRALWDAREAIPDEITREIGIELSRQEAREAKLEHLSRLADLVTLGAAPQGASPRVLQAFERARAQLNFSALEALERELDRDREEEDLAVVLAILE
jgi:hypothetical protein